MPGRISQHRQRRSKGAVFVEAGFVFIIFAFMLMGAFDFGQFLFIHQALVERSRSAARWGAAACHELYSVGRFAPSWPLRCA